MLPLARQLLEQAWQTVSASVNKCASCQSPKNSSLATFPPVTLYEFGQNRINPLLIHRACPLIAIAAGGARGRAGGPEVWSIPQLGPRGRAETGGKPGYSRKKRVPLLFPPFVAPALCQLWHSPDPSGSWFNSPLQKQDSVSCFTAQIHELTQGCDRLQSPWGGSGGNRRSNGRRETSRSQWQ